MKERLDKTSSVSAKISVELPPERVNAQLEAYYSSVAKHAKIQGFRKGKAPLAVIKKMYKEDASSYIGERLISEGLSEAIRKYELHIILPPKLVAVDSPAENQVFRFEAELDLKPEVPSVDCSLISISIPKEKEIGSEDVDREIESIRESFATYEALEPAQRSQVKADDSVSIRYTGSVNGQKIEKASTDRQQVVLGKSQVLEDFEKALPEMKVGEVKTLKVNFGDSHPIEEIRGKEVEFQLEVLEILEKRLPEVNDEFLKQVDPSLSKIEELREKISSDLKNAEISRIERARRDAIGKALVEKYPFEISARQRQMTGESLLRDNIQNLMRMGLTQAQIQTQQKELLEEASKAAEHQIKLAYILDQIARQEEINVTDEDVKSRLQKTADRTGYSLTEIEAYYSQKEENEATSRMDRLKMDIRDEKSLDYALSKATIKLEG